MNIIEAADRLNRAAIGVQKRAQVDAIARKHRPKISAFFRNQKAITLERFKEYQFLFTESYRTLREEVHPNELFTTHDWDRLWQDIDRDTFDELQKIIAGIEGESVLKGAAFGVNQIGKITPDSPTFSLANPRAVAYFMRTGGSTAYISGIQQTTSDQIKILIGHAIETGQAYTKTAKEISDTFDGFSRERAQRIAVNEATHAYENGNLIFAQGLVDEGINMEHAWNTSGDEKVCDTCNENEAVGYIPIDEPFPSGDIVPPAHLGDRCYATYRQAQPAND